MITFTEGSNPVETFHTGLEPHGVYRAILQNVHRVQSYMDKQF